VITTAAPPVPSDSGVANDIGPFLRVNGTIRNSLAIQILRSAALNYRNRRQHQRRFLTRGVVAVIFRRQSFKEWLMRNPVAIKVLLRFGHRNQ
jgi:hypothetical protein